MRKYPYRNKKKNRIEKKNNVVPIHKNVDKQTIKNYHRVLLLPICGLIFRCLL